MLLEAVKMLLEAQRVLIEDKIIFLEAVCTGPGREMLVETVQVLTKF